MSDLTRIEQLERQLADVTRERERIAAALYGDDPVDQDQRDASSVAADIDDLQSTLAEAQQRIVELEAKLQASNHAGALVQDLLNQAEARLAACQTQLDELALIKMMIGETAIVDKYDGMKQRLAEVVAALEEAFMDIMRRARRIREDKAVVGIEAFYIETVARAALAAAKERRGDADLSTS